MTSTPTRERARPMAPEERRRAIIAVTRPLLLEHGRATTTRMIAEAAGIAEGTIFRVFESKEELFEEAMLAAFDGEPFLAALDDLADRADAEQVDLRDRLLACARLYQERYRVIFRLMVSMGCSRPPRPADPAEGDRWREQVQGRMVALLTPFSTDFRLPLEDVVRTLGLLMFSGTHPHISQHRPLAAEDVVDLLLHGTLRHPGPPATEGRGRS